MYSYMQAPWAAWKLLLVFERRLFTQSFCMHFFFFLKLTPRYIIYNTVNFHPHIFEYRRTFTCRRMCQKARHLDCAAHLVAAFKGIYVNQDLNICCAACAISGCVCC